PTNCSSDSLYSAMLPLASIAFRSSATQVPGSANLRMGGSEKGAAPTVTRAVRLVSGTGVVFSRVTWCAPEGERNSSRNDTTPDRLSVTLTTAVTYWFVSPALTLPETSTLWSTGGV